mgnify:CR=1 FL=1
MVLCNSVAPHTASFSDKCDIANDKLELAKSLGADLTVNALEDDPGEYLKKETGAMHCFTYERAL